MLPPRGPGVLTAPFHRRKDKPHAGLLATAPGVYQLPAAAPRCPLACCAPSGGRQTNRWESGIRRPRPGPTLLRLLNQRAHECPTGLALEVGEQRMRIQHEPSAAAARRDGSSSAAPHAVVPARVPWPSTAP